DCLGFYPLVLGFARHYYPFYLLVLLLSLALHLVGPVLGRMCLIPPHPLLLGFLLPPALHPVSLDPLRICPVPLHPVYLLPVFLLLFPGLYLVSLVLDQRCPAPHSFPSPAFAAQALYTFHTALNLSYHPSTDTTESGVSRGDINNSEESDKNRCKSCLAISYEPSYRMYWTSPSLFYTDG